MHGTGIDYKAPWGWHDSVETCRSVIICEIIVHLLGPVQNNKRGPTHFSRDSNRIPSQVRISRTQINTAWRGKLTCLQYYVTLPLLSCESGGICFSPQSSPSVSLHWILHARRQLQAASLGATEEDYCIPDNSNKEFQEFQEYVRLDDIKLVERSGLVLRCNAPWSLSSHEFEKPCCDLAFIAQGMFRSGKI